MLHIDESGGATWLFPNAAYDLGVVEESDGAYHRLSPTGEFWQFWKHNNHSARTAGFVVEKHGKGDWRVALRADAFEDACGNHKAVTLRHNLESDVSLAYRESAGAHQYMIRQAGLVRNFTFCITEAIEIYNNAVTAAGGVAV